MGGVHEAWSRLPGDSRSEAVVGVGHSKVAELDEVAPPDDERLFPFDPQAAVNSNTATTAAS